MSDQELIAAVRSISHGGVSGPTGLEMLSIAVGGEGPGSLAEAVREGLQGIATSIDHLSSEIGDLLRQQRS